MIRLRFDPPLDRNEKLLFLAIAVGICAISGILAALLGGGA